RAASGPCRCPHSVSAAAAGSSAGLAPPRLPRSHSSAVLSELPVTSVLPSGRKSTAASAPRCPSSRVRSPPVATSHSQVVRPPPPPPRRRRRPAGRTRDAAPDPADPLEAADLPGRLQVPHAHRQVVAGRSQQPAVRRQGELLNRRAVGLHALPLAAGGEVPDL